MRTFRKIMEKNETEKIRILCLQWMKLIKRRKGVNCGIEIKVSDKMKRQNLRSRSGKD